MEDKPFSKSRLSILAFFAAFFDSFAGGGWGPITATFIWLLGFQQFRWDWIMTLIIVCKQLLRWLYSKDFG